MKQASRFAAFVAIALTTGVISAQADESAESTEGSVEPRIAVFMPERIDAEWFWYHYTDVSQHIVQSEIEKALERAGYHVIDLQSASAFADAGDVTAYTSTPEAVRIAEELGATHVVVGEGTATMMSRDVAYGVTVFRSQSDITAKLVRIEGAKVIDVLDASAVAGGQAQKTAGRDALKDAGKDVARALVRACDQHFDDPDNED